MVGAASSFRDLAHAGQRAESDRGPAHLRHPPVPRRDSANVFLAGALAMAAALPVASSRLAVAADRGGRRRPVRRVLPGSQDLGPDRRGARAARARRAPDRRRLRQLGLGGADGAADRHHGRPRVQEARHGLHLRRRLDSGAILRRLPVPEPRFPEADDNPRGGVRGGGASQRRPAGSSSRTTTRSTATTPSGTSSTRSAIHCSSTSTRSTGTERRCGCRQPGSTPCSSLADWDVEVAWDPYRSPLAQRLGIGTRPHAIDGSLDYRIREAPLIDRCHINSVMRRDGSPLVNLGLVRESSPAAVRLGKRARARLRRALGRRRVRPGDERKWGKGVVVEDSAGWFVARPGRALRSCLYPHTTASSWMPRTSR